MWTLVLLLLPIAAVLSAPVNLPQTITCPDNNIFVYVNGSAHDRTPYIFVELNATDLHDCIHKCFGNQFCYSLKYESTAVEPCSLYYFAAYNCSGQKLVKARELQYPGGAITIDCLRCPANGDFVTAPPFDSFTEQTIVAKDAAGNPILSKPLDKVVTDNIELKLAPGHVVPVGTTEQPQEESTTSEAGKEDESTTSTSTTTAVITMESRKMVEERKCSGSLKYRVQTDIDRETVQLLLNETTVESGNECAQLCYDLKCGFAYYKPSEKICRFTSNTEDVVDGSSCDEASEHSVPEEEVVVTCISCDIEASPARNIPHKGEASPPRIDFSVDASPSPPTIVLPASTNYPACIINFQLDEEADTLSFKHYEVKKVKSVNECARICFRGGCSTAVFSPQSLECRLGSELKETCTNAPSTIRYLKQADVKIQCFRCSSPKHFAKEIEAQQTGTTTPVISHQEDQQGVSQHVDEAPPTTRPTSTESPAGASTPGQQPIEQKLNISDEQAPFGKNCIIKFQARPLSKRPAELNAPFELDLNVDSVELCATRCYQDGCSGAKYDPSNGTCSLAYNDKHFCAKEPTVLHYKADEVTWIHCVNCYSDKDLSGSPKEPATKSPIAIVPAVLPGGTTTEKVATTETATTGPEESASTHPSSKEGSEETTAKTTTARTEATEATSSEGPEEAKSTSAPKSTPSKEEETPQNAGATSTHKPGLSKDFLRGCLIKFQARPIEDRPSHLKAEFEISLTVDSVELCATRCYQDGCTGAKYDPEAKSCALSYNDKQFCSNAAVQLHYDAQNVTWIHCVNCYSIKDSDRVELAEQQEATPEHVSVDEGGEKLPAAVEGSTTAIPEEIEPKQVLKNRTRTGSTPHFQKQCAVKFQARPYSKRPAESKAPFEIEVPVDSIELCATRCFQDGCTGAKYDPKSKSCSLSYADKHFCEEDSEVLLHYDAKEPTWIYCVNCYSVKPGPTGARPEEQNVTEPAAEITASPSEATTESETSETGGTAVPVLPGATTAGVGSSEGVTTSEEESSTAQPSSTERPKEPETTQNVTALSDDELKNLLDKGCVVTFQIVELEERPPEFTSSFDPPFETETAEICAYRCYQDGCTGAKYDPVTRECALSYNDRAQCSNAKLVQVARPQQPVFMHCFSCVPHLMLPNMTRPGPFSESIDNAPGTEEKPVTAPTAQATEAVESTTSPSEAESSTPLGTTGTAATTSPTAEAAVTEASGEEATTGPSESTTPHKEASGEEPLGKTIPAEGSEIPSTSAASESTATPQSSTGTVAVVFVPVEGATTAAPSSEGITEQPLSTSPEEASGEEPSERSTTPRIEASVDGVGTTESTTVGSTTSGNIATEETIAPKVSVKMEGSVTEPSLTEATTEKGVTTSPPEEASGEEPVIKSTTPGEQAGSGESSTAPTGDHSTIEAVPRIIAVTEQSTTATSTHSRAFESTPEITTIVARTDLTTPASTLGSESTSATTSPTAEGLVTEASGEEATTEKSELTTTHEEPSGEEPLDKNAVPGVQANVDENATVQVTAESTPIGSSTTASTSEITTPLTQGTTLVPIVFVPAEGSTTHSSSEQTTTEGFSTITPKEGASGEEPLDKSALPTVQESLDETTTGPAVSMPESSTLETGTTPSSTEESPKTTPAVESFVTEASGEESTTERSQTTTTSPGEASGEEPIDKTAVGEVLSGSELTTTVPAENTSEGSATGVPGSSSETTPQGITIVPVAFVPVKATTEASSEQTTTEKESTTSSPEEASGEGPLDKNAIPVVQASLDETTTSVAVESTPETSPTTASGPSSSELTTATTSSPAEAFTTEASGEKTKPETSTVAIPPIIPVVSTTTSAAETSGEEPSSTNARLGEEISVPAEATTGHTTLSTTPGEGASGEELLDKNAVPKVEASVDEIPSSTVGSKEEGSTTVAPEGETASGPSSSELSTAATSSPAEAFVTEASGEETRPETSTVAIPPIIPVVSTTTLAAETSGEEPSSSTNAGLGEEVSVPAEATTGHTTLSTTPGEGASGEEPLDKNAVPKVEASVDETPSSTVGSKEESPTTVGTETASGPSSSELTTATTSSAAEAFVTEASGEEARPETSTVAIPPVIPVVSTTTSAAETSGEEPSPTNAGLREEISVPAEATTGHTTLSTTPGEGASGEEPLDKNAVPKVEASVDETPSSTVGSKEEGSTTVAPGGETATTRRVVVTVAPIVFIPVPAATTASSERTNISEELSTTPSEEASGKEPLSKSVSEATTVPAELTSGTSSTTSSAPGTQEQLATTASSPVEGSGLEASKEQTTTEASGISVTTPLTTEETLAPKVFLTETATEPARDQTATEKSTVTTSSSEEASGEEPLDKNALPKVAASIDEAPTTAEHTPETVTVTLAIATSPLPSSPEGEEATSSPAVQSTKLPTTTLPEEASGEEPLDKSAIPGVQAKPDGTSSTAASTTETSTGQTEHSSTGHSTEETLAPAVSVIVESTVTEPGLSTTAKTVTTSSPEEASGEEPLDRNAAPDVQASLDETTTASDVTTSSSGTETTSSPSTAKVIVPIILLPDGSKTPTSSEPTTGEQATTPAEEASGEQPLDKNALPQKEGQETTTTTESTGGKATTTSGTGGDEVDVPTTSVPLQGSVTGGELTTTVHLESSGEEPDKSAAVTDFTRVQGTTTPSEESSGEEPVVSNTLPKVASSIDEGTTKVLSTDEPGKASTEPSTEAGTEHSGEEPTAGQPPSHQSTTTGQHEATTPGEVTAETSTVSIPPIIPVVETSVSPSTSNIEESRSSTVAIPPIIPVSGERENEPTTPAVEASGEEPAVSKTPSAEENANESTSTTPFTTVSSANQEEIFVPTGAAGEHTTSSPSEEGSGEEPSESNKVPQVEASMDEAAHSTATEASTGGPTTTLVFILPGGAVTEKSGTTTPTIEASGEDPHHIPKIEPNINEITSTALSSTIGSHEASTGSSTTVVSENDHSTVGAFVLGSDQTRATTVSPLESSTTGQLVEETTPTNEVRTSPSAEGSGEESVEGSTPRVDFSIDESRPIVRVIPGVIVSIERITEASPENTTHSQTILTTTSAHTTGDENEASSSTSEPQTTTTETEASGEEPLGSTNLPKVEAKVDEGAIDVPSTEASKTPEETPSSSPATSSPEGGEAKASTVALPPVIPVIGVSGSTSTPSGVEEGGSSTVEIAPLIPATPVTGEGETSTAAMPPIIPVGSTTTAAEETSGEEPTSSTNAGFGDEISVPEGAQLHPTTSPESTSTNPEEASGEGPLESNTVSKVQASLDDGAGSANSPDKSTEGPASTLEHSTGPPLGHPHLLFGPSTTSASVSALLNVHATEPVESSTPLNKASEEEPSERQSVPKTETSPEGSSTSPPTETEEAGVSTTAAPSSDHSTQESVPTLLAVSEQSTTATSTQPGAAVTGETGKETTPQAEESTTSSVEGSGEEGVTSTTPKLDSSTDDTRSPVRIVPGVIVSVQQTTEVPEVTGSEPSSHPSSSTPSAPSQISSEQTTVEKTYESTTGTPNEATTTSTTSSSVEGSGEESELGKSPTVEASVDDSKTTVTVTTEPSEESTTSTLTSSETQSSEPSSTTPITETISGVHVVPLLVVSPTGRSDERPTTREETAATTTPGVEGNESTSTRPTVSSVNQEEIFVPTKAAGEHPTMPPSEESSGETPIESNTVPKLEASHDGETSTESASTAHASTPSEPLVFLTDRPDGKTSTESTVHSSTPSEPLEFITDNPDGKTSTESARPHASTPSEPLVFLTDSLDGKTSTESTAHSSTPSEPLEFITDNPDGKTSTETSSKAHSSTPSEPLVFLTDRPDGKTSTESTAHSSTPSEPLVFLTDRPDGKTSTESTAHSSTPSEPLEFITDNPDGKTSTETSSKAHSSTPSEPLVFLTDSSDEKTITESTAHASTPSEPLEFITDSPDGKTTTETSSKAHSSTPSEPLEFITGSADVESHTTTTTSNVEGPAPSHPLDSSFVQDVTPSTSEDLINRTLLEPHKTSLPINVGFVPGSEPDTFTESEEEEEESENTELTTQPDYEDAVASKKAESTSVATSTTAGVSTTTEPPVQAVQDLIDALAAGGLNAVLGPPRQTQLVENVNSKLGDLKKYLHKPLEQKQDCASRRLRFVASELTDLSTRFSADAAVYSLQHCARMCYETGCTLAAFTRFPRPVCLMRYGNSTTACDSGAKRTSSWSFASVQQVVKLECLECEKNSEFITQKEQIDITNLKNGFSTDDLNTVVPAHEGLSSKCDGRLEFQTLPVGSLPRLNITNDVPARTPADCAKKCFEAGGCSTAGFIASPTGNISHGVCLLTSDLNVCGNNADYVPQYAALNPFVISCIKCTPCTYNIRSVTPDRVLPEFNHAESVSSIGECARACYARRCTIAQYSSQQKSCMMTSEPMESQCAREVAVVTEGVLPVTLECVSCSS